MFYFDAVNDIDLDSYAYELYDNPTGTGNPIASGKNKANVFTISVTNSTDSTPKTYYGKVAVVNSAGTVGTYTSLVPSGATPLISSQYINNLIASKIESGTIGAHTITLGGATSIIKSSTYNFASPSTTPGWFIKGDGTTSIGGANGINYNGTGITLGSNVTILSGAAVPNSSGVAFSGLTISTAVGTVGGLQLGGNSNNQWLTSGYFRAGNNSNYIEFVPTANNNLGELSVNGKVISTTGRIGPFDISDTGMTSFGYNAQNYMKILNYGDIEIFSAPTSGGHQGMTHKTELVGEYIVVGRTDLATSRYITVGSTNGAPGNIGIEIVENNSSRFRIYQDGALTVAGYIAVGGTGITDAGSVSANGWFRSKGQTGWYNQDYGGGIYMDESTTVKVYNDKNFLTNGTILSGGLITGGIIANAAINGHILEGTNGIRFPGPRNGTHSNMPSDHNFSLNFQYSNTGGYIYVLVNGDNGVVRRITTTASSDRRVKNNITPDISNQLNKFYSLTPYEFEYNENLPLVGDDKFVPDGKRIVGLIADEVEELFPDYVLGKKETEYQQVDYQDFTKLLIAASIEQNKRIEELSAKVDQLESRLV